MDDFQTLIKKTELVGAQNTLSTDAGVGWGVKISPVRPYKARGPKHPKPNNLSTVPVPSHAGIKGAKGTAASVCPTNSVHSPPTTGLDKVENDQTWIRDENKTPSSRKLLVNWRATGIPGNWGPEGWWDARWGGGKWMIWFEASVPLEKSKKNPWVQIITFDTTR